MASQINDHHFPKNSALRKQKIKLLILYLLLEPYLVLWPLLQALYCELFP